jgi:glucose/arabinose dehydrogenase
VTPREGYAIPKDNPFVGKVNARPEIYAYGVRNPWRMSFDRETGLLYAGEVGQNLWEMVHIIKNGGNYGWNIMEGTHPFHPVENPPEFVKPIKEYPHSLGLSISGGYVYRGKSIPSLVGWYLYADYAKGQVWGLKYENGEVTGDEQLLQMRGQPSSFGEDKDGELYICDHGIGTVSKIVAE